MARVEDLLRAALRGENVSWPEGQDPLPFLKLTQEQGLQPLVYHCLRESGSLPCWPGPVLEALRAELHRQVARELVLERELADVLAALNAAGVRPLLLKGTPLAATHYPEPALRARMDTDLLIERTELPALDAALRPLGYERASAVSGDLVVHQCMYHGRINLDVHWKIMNPALLAGLFPASELHERAVPVPVYGPHARTLCPAHALLLACVHRVGHHAHHGQSERWLWLYDIHLLAQRMEEPEFEAFARGAAAKRVRSLCLSGLEAARARFGTRLIEGPLRRFLDVPEADSDPSARFLRPRLTRLDLWLMDLRALRGRERLRLVREHLFPPAEYMLQKYHAGSRLLLPVLYLRRALSGAWRVVGRGR